MRAAVWAAANQLGVVAGTPGELLTALLSGPRRPIRVTLPARDPDSAELAASLRQWTGATVTVEPPGESRAPARPPGSYEPADPGAVCAADPERITLAYEAAGDDDFGGLGRAWLRAGQSLVRAGRTPADRALLLLAALPDGADPRLAPALADLSADTPWRVTGTRDAQVAALATDHRDRLIVVEDPRVKALACLPDGTRLRLDERGRLRTDGPPGSAPRLVLAVATTLADHPATALAATGDLVVTGDRMGSLHAFGLDGLHQSAPHSGRVTALAVTGAPRVHSGGADGTVRSWRPGRPPHRSPVTRRPYPVVALHAADTGTGTETETGTDTGGDARAGVTLATGWADGLVTLHRPGAARPSTFRPGRPVRAVAVLRDGSTVIGTDESLIRLRPR
ncbi:hypothetical protein [Streptomyces sp. NPDC047928]|uniref:hypothetical protein n=1 Tax=unclassified Streptomyces TaxID=2593676 RepID=UPI00371D7BB2